MSVHTFAIGAVGTSLRDIDPFFFAKEVRALFPGHDVAFASDNQVLAVRVLPDLDAAEEASLNALAATHQDRRRRHLYLRGDVDARVLNKELQVLLPGIELRVQMSGADLRVLVEAELDAAQIAALDAAVAAHKASGVPLQMLKRKRIERIRLRTRELLELGFRFEGRTYAFDDYIYRATPPTRIVSIDGIQSVALGDGARIAAFAAAATAAERTVRHGEGVLVDNVLRAATKGDVQAIVDSRADP